MFIFSLTCLFRPFPVSLLVLQTTETKWKFCLPGPHAPDCCEGWVIQVSESNVSLCGRIFKYVGMCPHKGIQVRMVPVFTQAHHLKILFDCLMIERSSCHSHGFKKKVSVTSLFFLLIPRKVLLSALPRLTVYQTYFCVTRKYGEYFLILEQQGFE